MSFATAAMSHRVAMVAFLACCAAAGPAVTSLLIDLATTWAVCTVRAGAAA